MKLTKFENENVDLSLKEQEARDKFTKAMLIMEREVQIAVILGTLEKLRKLHIKLDEKYNTLKDKTDACDVTLTKDEYDMILSAILAVMDSGIKRTDEIKNSINKIKEEMKDEKD